MFLCKCLRFALKAGSLRLVCHRLSFSMMCGLMGFCVWRSLPTIALWGFGEVLPSRGTEFEGSLLPTGSCITICRGSSMQGGNIQPYSLLVEEYQQLSSKRFEKCNVIHLCVYICITFTYKLYLVYRQDNVLWIISPSKGWLSCWCWVSFMFNFQSLQITLYIWTIIKLCVFNFA